MRRPAIRPRPDQIAELTRGIRLPLPAIPKALLLVLAESLSKAFAHLCIECPTTMTSGDEQEVTALLEARLNSMITEDPLLGKLVWSVVRGRESTSFDGSHLQKRPDLSLHLSDRERNFPLVAEAKILDSPHRKTVDDYCRKGLARFINGEYAWANQEAFMIGYVRDASSIDPELKSFLAPNSTAATPYLVEELSIPVSSNPPDLAYTRHRRSFVYRGQLLPNSPGPISILHLWLS